MKIIYNDLRVKLNIHHSIVDDKGYLHKSVCDINALIITCLLSDTRRNLKPFNFLF